MEFKGKGSLTVTGNKGHAIQSKEYVSVKNCTLTIDNAVKDGINCAQYFLQESGIVTISKVGDDALQVDFKDTEGERDADDTGCATFNGGLFTATTTAKAAKCVKAEGDVLITGGQLTARAEGGGVWDDTKSKTKASACLGADGDVVISGGELNLTATGSGGKGISCDGTFKMTDGKLEIKTSGGIFAYVNGTVYDNYTGNTDRLDSDYKSSPKGVKADTYAQIDGGEINVEVTGRGAEGIESKGELTINGGKIHVYAYDDCINSSSHMNINGGDICVISTNNDGLDANGNLCINGGYTRAFGASSPECGIDANEEEGYTVIITGGTLLAVGGGNSTPTTSASTQAFVKGSGSASAGTNIKLKSGDNILAEFEVPSEYKGNTSGTGGGPSGGRPGGGGSAAGSILISCPGIVNGNSYTLVNNTSSSSVTATLKGSGGGRPW